jgi:5'-nucleotidase
MVDLTMEAELQEAGKDVIARTKKEVGKTRVFLDGTTLTCRLYECNLGSLIADAMVEMASTYNAELTNFKLTRYLKFR